MGSIQNEQDAMPTSEKQSKLANIRVSVVCTVYNKSASVVDTIASLRRQLPEESIEYIFIDDCSTDNSFAVVESQLADAPHKRVMQNDVNSGPSVSVNKAASQAQGDYLFLIDGDDIAPLHLLQNMLTLLETHQADFIYGKTLRTDKSLPELLAMSTSAEAVVDVIDSPVDYVCSHSLVRMSLMVKRDTFVKAQGCDTGVFIQDISLPLRLGAVSSRMLMWHENALIMPVTDAPHLSNDKTQQHHDQFLTYYRFLQSHLKLSDTNKQVVYRKMISTYWKHCRQQSIGATKVKALLFYLRSRRALPKGIVQWIEDTRSYFLQLKGVRRGA